MLRLSPILVERVEVPVLRQLLMHYSNCYGKISRCLAKKLRLSVIQVEAGRMALLLEQRVVVPASGDDLTRRDLLLLDPALDLGHELVDVRDVTHRRGEIGRASCRERV